MNFEYVRYRILKSREAVRDAKVLCANEGWNAAINRLYYASFYAVSALVTSENINAKTHEGIKSQFNLLFIKTGVFESKYGQLFSDLMNLRHKGDYGDLFDFDREAVERFLPPVEDLVTKIADYINDKIC